MWINPNTITITPYTTPMDAKHSIPVKTDIVNMGRITTRSNMLFDSHNHITRAKIPNVGETWHYKIPGASALSTGYVKEVTAHTVVISNNRWDDGSRYVTDELEFIEKV